MKFMIQIDTENDAMVVNPEAELEAIMQRVVKAVTLIGVTAFTDPGFALLDSNGNRVGFALYEEEDDD